MVLLWTLYIMRLLTGITFWDSNGKICCSWKWIIVETNLCCFTTRKSLLSNHLDVGSAFSSWNLLRLQYFPYRRILRPYRTEWLDMISVLVVNNKHLFVSMIHFEEKCFVPIVCTSVCQNSAFTIIFFFALRSDNPNPMGVHRSLKSSIVRSYILDRKG